MIDRITLAMLEVTNGDLTAATLDFRKGLNVVSGTENRGKSYAFSCLDFLLGAKDAPEVNPHTTGYTTATVYYTVNDNQRGVVRREFESGEAEFVPLHPVDSDVPHSGWVDLAKTHTAKKLSLSAYWVKAFGFPVSILRGSMSGDTKALTVRFLAHLVLVDEMRIMDKRSPARQTQATQWPADADALALVLDARRNAPTTSGTAVVVVHGMIPEVRSFIEREIERLNAQIQTLGMGSDAETDEAAEITRQATDFTTAADEAARGLRTILGQLEDAQKNLTMAKAKAKTSKEITSRLELLQDYYQSDMLRLEAVTETAFLLKQLNPVPCPLCNQLIEADSSQGDDELSKEYLEQVQLGAKREANKIRNLRNDLAETLTRSKDDLEQASGSEGFWASALDRLRDSERTQSQRVAEIHTRLNQTFAALGQLAQRQALKQRRTDLQGQLGEPGDEPAEPAEPPEERTDFDSTALDEFCTIIKNLLIAWKWNYTDGPLTVRFDITSTDILVCDLPRKSFGKAVRALLSSAFIIGVMDYCFKKGLPHPGFVVLDSPLTTKKGSGQTLPDDAPVPDDIQTAFFTHLAENYADRQVIIFDNKEPPASLGGKINHVIFDDGVLATRKGFFP